MNQKENYGRVNKKVIILFLIALSLIIGKVVSAQTKTVIPTGNKNQITKFADGLAMDSALYIPKGCGAPALPVAYQTALRGAMIYEDTCNSVLYVYNPHVNLWASLAAPVISVFGRTGAITAQVGDYSVFYYPLAGNPSNFLTSISGIAAGGGLSGTYPNPTVNFANGYTLYDLRYFTIPTGTTAQYIRGNGSLATFPTDNTAFTNGAGYLTGGSLTGYVPTTRTINGTSLVNNLTITTSKGTNSFPLTVTNGSTNPVIDIDTNFLYQSAGLGLKKTSFYNAALDDVQNIVVGGNSIQSYNQNTLGMVTYPPGFGYINFTTIRGPQFGYHTSIDNIYIFRDSFMCRRAGGLTYYVSESGNDANTGLSPEQAFRKIATAVAAANCLTVRVLSGVYGINEWPTGNQTASINFIISPDAHIGSFLKKSTWAQDGTYSQLVYVQDSHVNGAFTALYNRLVKETLSGNFRRFEPAGSLIECSTRFGTYFISNDTLWANYPTVPGNDYNSLLFQTNGRIVITNTTRHDSCYWEGGRLYGTELWQMDGTAGIVPFAAQRDVNIVRSSGTFDVINSKGYSLGSYAVTIWQAGTGDGFNYHTQGNQLGTDTMKNWEINCRVLDEKGQADHDQASTLHNHSKCMTINCQYISNGDQVIHDIDTSLRCILGSQLLSVEGESVVRASALTQTYIQNTTLGGGFNTTYDLFAASGTIWVDGVIFRKPILFTITSFIKKWTNP